MQCNHRSSLLSVMRSMIGATLMASSLYRHTHISFTGRMWVAGAMSIRLQRYYLLRRNVAAMGACIHSRTMLEALHPEGRSLGQQQRHNSLQRNQFGTGTPSLQDYPLHEQDFPENALAHSPTQSLWEELPVVSYAIRVQSASFSAQLRWLGREIPRSAGEATPIRDPAVQYCFLHKR